MTHIKTYNSRLYTKPLRIHNSSFYGVLDPNSTFTSASASALSNNWTSALIGLQTFIQLPCSSDTNISYVNFSYLSASDVVLKACVPIDDPYYANTDDVFVTNINYHNVTATSLKLQWDMLTVVYDADGTFSQFTTASPRRLLT